MLDRLALGVGQAAALISRAERRAQKSALAIELFMRQAAELTAVVALDRPLIIIPGTLHGLPFFQRAIAARRASSRRCLGLSFAMCALPPSRRIHLSMASFSQAQAKARENYCAGNREG
ncbi:MAG TPA: hypothetical protein VM822_18740 [Pseudolabrys sp.]|nr:hypothetical protein [Pseudolabrys sp.]